MPLPKVENQQEMSFTGMFRSRTPVSGHTQFSQRGARSRVANVWRLPPRAPNWSNRAGRSKLRSSLRWICTSQKKSAPPKKNTSRTTDVQLQKTIVDLRKMVHLQKERTLHLQNTDVHLQKELCTTKNVCTSKNVPRKKICVPTKKVCVHEKELKILKHVEPCLCVSAHFPRCAWRPINTRALVHEDPGGTPSQCPFTTA